MGGRLLTVLYFFVTFYSLGFSFLHLMRVKIPGDMFERNVLRLGAGIAIMPLLLLLFQYIGVPLHWAVLFIVAVALPLVKQGDHWLVKGNLKRWKMPRFDFGRFEMKWTHLYHVIACILVLVLFLVYLKGAFGYPYLEDDDPWYHAIGAEYVSQFNTYWVDADLEAHVNDISQYLWPYPPFYTSMMGILHQLNDSINWTLKFFDVLLVALGVLFFYVFASSFLKSHKFAVLAAAFLVFLPSYLSHFIWAETLSICAFFPTIFALSMVYAKGFDKRWFFVAMILIGSNLIIQPWATGIFGFFFGFYWVARVISERSLLKSKYVFIAIFLGTMISMLFWIPSVFIGVGGQKYDYFFSMSDQLFHGDDSLGSTTYGMKDFIVAPTVSKMDQATGLGFFVFALCIFALIVSIANFHNLKRDAWFWSVILWFLFCLYNFVAMNFGWIKLTAPRMWAFFSIPVSLLAAYGILAIRQLFKKQRAIAYLAIALIFLGVLITSGQPKYVVQTSHWPPGMLFRSNGEIQGYGSLQSLPAGTRVVPLCDAEKDRLIYGMDMISEKWDVGLYDFRMNLTGKSAESIVSFMRARGFEFMILDTSCVTKYGLNETNEMIMSLQEHATLLSGNEGFVMFRL